MTLIFRRPLAVLATLAALASSSVFSVSTVDAREIVSAKVPLGTILVRTGERGLYYGIGSGRAIRYDVAVGREAKQWTGKARVKFKRWLPAWSPTPEIIRDNPNIPRVIPGGAPNNPMGVAALVLNKGSYAIHGTNRPELIGSAASYGCIRMRNQDIAELYERIGWRAKVVVTQ